MPLEVLRPSLVRKIVKQGGPAGRFSDGGGLFLLVRPSGNASWILRFQRNGVRRDMGLGRARDLTLQDVRDKARAMRRQIALGHDPLDARHAARREAATRRGLTFGAAAETLMRQREGNGDAAKTIEAWRGTFKRYVLPVIGDIPVADVQRAHVLSVIEPLWHSKNETAQRVRWRIEAVLDAAAAREQRSTENPARWAVLKPILGARRQRTQHHAAVDWRALPALMRQLREQDSMAARALQFTVLTAARTNETIRATWDEIDGDTWRIPPTRMKAKREHRIPLCRQARELLDRLHNVRRPPFIFFGRKEGQPLSDMAMLRVIWDMPGSDFTTHGMRSAFRDWCSDNGHDRELAEQALAHTRQGVEAAYARSDLFGRRRELMAAWGAFCDGAR